MKDLIFVAGVYGVGKSTLCNSLSKILNIDFFITIMNSYH